MAGNQLPPRPVAIDRERFSHLRWRRFADMRHAASHSAVPLAAPEISRAMLHLPLAFAEKDGAVTPIALLGYRPGENLFVGASGSWRSAYIPAVLRAHPFLLSSDSDNRYFLCIDEHSASITEDPDDEPFFDASGDPAPATKAVFEFLVKLDRGLQQARRLAAQLREAELLKTWDLQLTIDGKAVAVRGIFCADRHRLNSLDAGQLKALEQTGALDSYFAQLLSMPVISRLHNFAQQEQRPPMTGESIDELFGTQDEVLSFGD